MVTSPVSRLGALRRLPRASAEFYALSDLDTARRVGGILWIFGAVIVAILLPVSPPTMEASTATGWALGGGVVALCLLSGALLLRAPRRVSPDALLAMGYVSLALIALLHWAGGPQSPYAELYIITVIYTSSVHPPRRVLVLMLTMAACLALPFLYDGWDSAYAADAVAHFLLWSSLSFAAVLFTAEVRVQRRDLLGDEQEASALARRDPLTGLGNRRAFDEALERVVAGARRADRPLSLVIGDIEGFKAVNDVHGHLEGDQCLRSVAGAIASSVRPSDDTFRWGGDEFAMLLPSTDYEQALVVVERIADAVARSVSSIGDRKLALRYGVAEIQPEMDAQALTAAADLNLMTAKAAAAQPAQ